MISNLKRKMSSSEFQLIASANYHQAAECLPASARGRQCVPCSLLFLITAQYQTQPRHIQPNDINSILHAGSHLYCAMSCLDTNMSSFVHPESLPVCIQYKNRKISVNHNGVVSGLVVCEANENVQSLQTALHVCCVGKQRLILVFGGVAVGIFFDGSSFFVFDSHARNRFGLRCPNGTAVVGIAESLTGLCNFISSLVQSIGMNPSVLQFDLHSFSFTTTHKAMHNAERVVKLTDFEPGFSIEPLKRKRKYDDLQQLFAAGKSFLSCVDDRNIPHDENCIIADFHKSVARGPDYVCSCCSQTYFKHYVCNIKNLSDINQSRYLNGILSVDACEWICQGCLKSIRKQKTPQFWIHNGLKFPDKPVELELTSLEERLVSPRLPFMQLREMPRGGQLNIKGNVVNVPSDVSSTIKSLPRMMHDHETIMLKLKRKLSYKHHVAFENIRPNKVFEAAEWLVRNSTLFQGEGIVLNNTWLCQSNESFWVNEEDSDMQAGTYSDHDGWTEDDTFNDRPTGNMDTCLQSIDFREFNQVLCLAPGENNTPLGLFQDVHSEVLSFPSIYCGQTRDDNSRRCVPLPYSSICKWELRNVDRRVALCIPNIFYKLKKLQIKQIKDKVSLAVRKCKMNKQLFTAGNFLTPGFVDQLTMQNDGYRVLRTLRGSPPYWEQAKRDLFSMIRQIGIPTWFCSFSAAETKWEPLLKSLTKLLYNKDITLEAAKDLSWQEKCKLIKSDPVTCARYFDHRVQIFIKDVLKHSSQPIGEIADFFYRVEFQQRGSPHIHMLVWVKGAPVHGVDNDTTIAAFVDKYVTCKNDTTIPELINYQTHRHARTCRTKGQNICRFNFPLFPMPETTLLSPLDSGSRDKYGQQLERIVTLLNDLHKADTNISFEAFLALLQMDISLYLQVVRSSLPRPRLFLKRSVSESRINSYNSLLLKSWLANMDLQFVLDAYSCVSYIVSYISKGQRGLSNLLMDAANESQLQDSCIKQQVRRIGNQFLSSVEIGAQEAVYLVLQMPLRRCTRDVVYVDTKKTNERTTLIKPYSQLKDLPSTSNNVEMDSVLKRYKRRPRTLENMCYADFCSWYDLQRSGLRKHPTEPTTTEELPETDFEFDKDDDVGVCGPVNYENVIRLPCGTCLRKRQRQKVIYTHITAINDDKEEHFRQLLMLYSHWRDDDVDLLNGFNSFEDSYLAKEKEVTENKINYEKCPVEQYASLLEDPDSDSMSSINAENQHQEAIDTNEGYIRPRQFDCFNPDVSSEIQVENYDIGDDLGTGKRMLSDGVLPHKEIDNELYMQQVRALNHEQKQFFYHILFRVKTDELPLYTFLSGGAGVGKSVVVRCIYQSLVKYLNHLRDESPDACQVLLCAPTGKAAHNIGGLTIHSAFAIPANQGFHFKPLDMQQLNTLRGRYHHLKMIIIDEISMVGRNMFNYINLRLQEIMGCTKPFGNVSVLAVGDLFQLKPVMDAWIFSENYATPQMSSLAPNLWTEYFEFYELKTVMRQKDDQQFAKLLNRLREGLHTDEDKQILQSRIVENTREHLRPLPHLFCRRKDTAEYNEAVLDDLSQLDMVTVEAIDDVSGDINIGMCNTILSKVPDDPNVTMGLHKILRLGIGLPGEICVNVDTEDGVTNGASCVIKKFDFRVRGSSRCSIIWVKFDDETIGRRLRNQYRNLYSASVMPDWTPILETNRKFTYCFFKSYLISRRQFPLCLSAGKTIHKAQGSTLKAAVLHFGNRKIDHIHYVGLSRVTSLTQVHITELNIDKVSVSADVEIEMERLRKDKVLTCSPDFRSFPSGVVKVCFQNCRSMQKHFEDIICDETLKSADIVAFAEARVFGKLDGHYMIEGFQVIAGSRAETSHGLVVYYKDSQAVVPLCCKSLFGIEYCLIRLNNEVVVCFVYCPPHAVSLDNFRQFLESVSTEACSFLSNFSSDAIVLMGDFNFDTTVNKSLSQLFTEKYRFKQLISAVTTDYGSCLDHIYTNLNCNQVVSSGTVESYYSDHKIIYLALMSMLAMNTSEGNVI